ncbi:MAG TPA: hypothetical protein VFA43_20315 [Gemmatimonadaceae bacterium]|nr:hypothetical protein [Gemmatimonadaceae bacterium]
MSVTRTTLAIAAALTTLTSCDVSHSPTTPAATSSIHKDGILGSLLHFLMPASNAPALATDTVKFYAVVGQERSASMWYHAASGQTDSTRWINFDVPAGGLVTDQNGDTLAAGDSVQITMYLADSANMVVGFQPSGLKFDSSHKPTLVMSYHWAKPLTPLLQALLGIWYQDTPGGLWFPTLSTVQLPAQTVTARCPGFSVYASAY